MTPNVLINLGQFEFELPRGWSVRFDNNPEDSVVYLSKQSALAEVRLFSAFEGDPEATLESFYRQTIYNLRSSGMHVDDVAEESDYEIVYELPSQLSSVEFVHYFFRLTGRMIIQIKLFAYFEADEDSIRQLLNSCVPHKHEEVAPNFSQLNFVPKTSSWSRLGDVYVLVAGSL